MLASPNQKLMQIQINELVKYSNTTTSHKAKSPIKYKNFKHKLNNWNFQNSLETITQHSPHAQLLVLINRNTLTQSSLRKYPPAPILGHNSTQRPRFGHLEVMKTTKISTKKYKNLKSTHNHLFKTLKWNTNAEIAGWVHSHYIIKQANTSKQKH